VSECHLRARVSDQIIGPPGPNAPPDCYPPLPSERRWTRRAAGLRRRKRSHSVQSRGLRNRELALNDARRIAHDAEQRICMTVDMTLSYQLVT